jgi:pantetheine-phosphate adenylyltransferase
VTKHLTAVYPGTFDPMTLGHEDLMRRAAGPVRPADPGGGRRPPQAHDVHHRRAAGHRHARSPPYGNVEVIAFRGLLRDFVVANGGKVVVRGLRAVSDFEYEFQMAGMNRQLMPEVETVFMTPSTSTSSSAAPSCARLPAWAVMSPSSWHPRCCDG